MNGAAFSCYITGTSARPHAVNVLPTPISVIPPLRISMTAADLRRAVSYFMGSSAVMMPLSHLHFKLCSSGEESFQTTVFLQKWFRLTEGTTIRRFISPIETGLDKINGRPPFFKHVAAPRSLGLPDRCSFGFLFQSKPGGHRLSICLPVSLSDSHRDKKLSALS